MKSNLKIIGGRILGILFAIFLTACGSGGGSGGEDGNLITEFNVPIADITVDGNRDDWLAVNPAATDAEGDDISSFTGADAKGLYIAQSSDGSTIYVMMDFYDGSPNSLLASSSTTDGNQQWPNVAMGYQVFFDENNDGTYDGELFARFDPNSGQWFQYVGIGWAIVNAQVAAGNVLEFSFPISEIGSPTQTYFKANVNTSAFPEQRENIPDFGAWVLIFF